MAWTPGRSSPSASQISTISNSERHSTSNLSLLDLPPVISQRRHTHHTHHMELRNRNDEARSGRFAGPAEDGFVDTQATSADSQSEQEDQGRELEIDLDENGRPLDDDDDYDGDEHFDVNYDIGTSDKPQALSRSFNEDSIVRLSTGGASRYKQHSNHLFPSSISVLPAELLILIFNNLTKKSDMVSVLTTCRAWCHLLIEMIWFRPNIQNKETLLLISEVLNNKDTNMFPYASLIKRLNLTSVVSHVTDDQLSAFKDCNSLERLTLTNCVNLNDEPLASILNNNPNLQSIDITQVSNITDNTINALATTCKRLQGLYATKCSQITDNSIIELANNCKLLKRIKLTQCDKVTDHSAYALATNCPALLEIDFFGCSFSTNESIHNLFIQLRNLREFRIASGPLLNDSSLTKFDNDLVFDRLRIIDLTCCTNVTDKSIESLVTHAPRLRNVVLSKCINITDRSLKSLARLSKSLHYVHLGHCSNITDYGACILIRSCHKLQYIDLACCTQLTNQTLVELSTLTKLRRIGLVKCANITDAGIMALVDRKGYEETLERVHLSYCTSLSLYPIFQLLRTCPKITHLSLTGVHAFLRNDLTRHCRSPPPDFTPQQQSMFCVFSGHGVLKLREELTRIFISPDGLNLFNTFNRSLNQQGTFHQPLQVPGLGFPQLNHMNGLPALYNEEEEEDLGTARQRISTQTRQQLPPHPPLQLPPTNFGLANLFQQMNPEGHFTINGQQRPINAVGLNNLIMPHLRPDFHNPLMRQDAIGQAVQARRFRFGNTSPTRDLIEPDLVPDFDALFTQRHLVNRRQQTQTPPIPQISQPQQLQSQPQQLQPLPETPTVTETMVIPEIEALPNDPRTPMNMLTDPNAFENRS